MNDVTIGTDDAVCYECLQDTDGKWYYTYDDHKVICTKCYGEDDPIITGGSNASVQSL